MENMKTIKGDLIQLALSKKFDLIIHGCNCFCSMGAGIARQIRETFPDAYQADIATTPGDKNKLGKYSQADIQINGKSLTIINGYTQYHYSGPNVLVDYEATMILFSLIKINFSGKTIGYPKIGAGLAKGDWEKISTIIDHQLEGENHTMVEYLSLQK